MVSLLLQTHVGFIGLGNMGAPMANNLLQKGHKLVVYDLVKSSVDAAVAAGATAAQSPAQVARNLTGNKLVMCSYSTEMASKLA